MTVARLQKQLAATELRIAKATQRRDEIAERLASSLSLTSKLDVDTSTMSTKALGELVADAARSHGGDCARVGYAHTSASWKIFRKRLAELVKRGER